MELEADREQLDRVVGLVRDALGPAVVGVYLHGSAALGRLQARSDLDVLAVSARPTTSVEKRGLVDGLLAVSGRRARLGPARPVELTIVVGSEVRPWRYPPSFDFQYGDWLREEFERGNLEPWPTRVEPDVASLLSMVLLANRPLLGPSPSEVLDPVPHDDAVRAMVDGVDSLLEDLDTDTRNVLLTLARVWTTVATGVIRSKDAAAAWALARLPEEHRPVLARARAAYLSEADERWEDLEPQVRRHAAHVVAEIEQAGRPARRSTPSRRGP